MRSAGLAVLVSVMPASSSASDGGAAVEPLIRGSGSVLPRRKPGCFSTDSQVRFPLCAASKSARKRLLGLQAITISVRAKGTHHET